MKKYIRLLIVMLLFVAINVKADYSSPGVVVNYTTVHKGDTIDLKLGNDFKWDESMIVSNYDEDEEEHELVKTADGTYLVEPIFIVVNTDMFDLDITDNKLMDDNYLFTDYKKTTYGDKTVYEFDFELKKIREDDEADYDGEIDHILLSNLKLKVNENAPVGTYYIETIRTTDFYEDYTAEEVYSEKLPISIIDEDTNEKSIKSYSLNTVSGGLVDKGEFNFDVDKNNYELLYFGEVSNSNIVCNTKCLVKGIGSGVYFNDEEKDLKYTIKFDDKTENFTVTNLKNKASIKSNWADNYSKSIIIVSNSSYTNAEELAKRVDSAINDYDGSYETNIYYYDKLNDTDKEILSYLNKSFDDLDKPYVYVIEDGKIIYNHQGEIEETEVSNVQKTINENREELINKSNSKLTDCDGSTCTINKDENLDLEAFIKENYMLVVIGLSVIIILLILLITIIKKSKNKEEII